MKTLVSTGAIVGSLIGSYLPTLFDATSLSFISLFSGGAGGILGIIIAYKLSEKWGLS